MSEPTPVHDWVELLRSAVAATSQSDVSRKIQISKTAICQILKGTYKSSAESIRDSVIRHLAPKEIDCPEHGRISTEVCDVEQRTPFAATSGERVRRWKACRACPRNTQKGGAR